MSSNSPTNVKGHATASESADCGGTEVPNESGEDNSRREAGCGAPPCSPSDFESVIRAVGLALSATHGTIATDCPDAKPDEKSWIVDHAKEIKMLEDMANSVRLALVAISDMGIVIPPLRSSIKESCENVLRNTAKSIAAAALESDNHSAGGGIISDRCDCGRSDRDHFHGDIILENA